MVYCSLPIVRGTSGFEAELRPGYGFPILPWVNISGGVSISASFLLNSSYNEMKRYTLKGVYRTMSLLFRFDVYNLIVVLIAIK